MTAGDFIAAAGRPLAPAVRRRRTASISAAHAAAAAVVAVGVLRLLAAFALSGPRLLPDEYLYSAISRSIAEGGLPSVRGETLQFMSILSSVLTAPAWLIANVEVAYRVAQAEGVLAISLAAVPAFHLARRVGLGERLSAVAAVAAVLVPDVGFGSLLVSEPFAYPLFLLAVLTAIDAVAKPGAKRELLFLGVWILLCLARVQFFFLPLVYLAAAYAATPERRLRPFVRAHRVVLGGLAFLAVVLVATGGTDRLVGRYGPLQHFPHDPVLIARWALANLLIVLAAAGWVTIPGAVLAFDRQLRGPAAVDRAFVTVTLLTTGALVGEAAIFGAGLGQLLERYTFYTVPLIVIGFLLAVETRLVMTRTYLVLAGALLAGTLLVPLDDLLFTGARDQSPTMAAVSALARHVGWAAPLVVGATLCLLALGAIVAGRRGARTAPIVLAAVVPVVASIAFAIGLASHAVDGSKPDGPIGSAAGPLSYLAFQSGTDSTALMSTLFWNPQIRRVIDLGGKSVDGFASIEARLAPGGRLVDASGPLSGAVVFDPGAAGVVLARGHTQRVGDLVLVPDVGRSRIELVSAGFPLGKSTVGSSGQVFAAAPSPSGTVRRRLRLWIRDPEASTHGWVLRFQCTNGFDRTLSVAAAERTISLPLVGRGTASCRFGVVRGSLDFANGTLASVRAHAVVDNPTSGGRRVVTTRRT